jgi:DNA mismatch repair ATPase MutS
VGKFYEVAGIDAILLAEHLGLALMGGPEVRVAKAGLPVDSLARHLRTLVREKGFEVVSDAEHTTLINAPDAHFGLLCARARACVRACVRGCVHGCVHGCMRGRLRACVV